MTERDPESIVRAERITAASDTFSHPWNPRSEIHGTRLSELAGLTRTGVSLARIPPGKESFAYHSHHREEEWIYVLEGRGIAEIDGDEHEVASGDFIGFPTPSVAHHMKNPYAEDLVYLMGGECRQVEIADFPRLNRRMLRRGSLIEIYRIDQAEAFGALEATDSEPGDSKLEE